MAAGTVIGVDAAGVAGVGVDVVAADVIGIRTARPVLVLKMPMAIPSVRT
jgi:hypothetical protein